MYVPQLYLELCVAFTTHKPLNARLNKPVYLLFWNTILLNVKHTPLVLTYSTSTFQKLEQGVSDILDRNCINTCIFLKLSVAGFNPATAIYPLGK